MANLQSDTFQSVTRPRIAAIVNGVLTERSPADFLADNPRALGTMTVTVGGTVADGNTATITVAHGLLPNGSKAFQITTASDTTATIANKLAALINGDASLRDLKVFATVVAAVITLKWEGPVGTLATVTVAVTGGGATLTRSGSGKFTGGTGPVIFVDNYRCAFNGITKVFQGGNMPDIVSADLLATLVKEGAPIY